MTADGTDDLSMAVPATAAAPAPAPPATAEVTEFAATTLPGWPVTWAALAVLIIGIALAAVGGTVVSAGGALVVIAAVALGGLTAIAPGEARVVQLLGRYAGTIRAQGLQWVSPVTKRRRISTRIRNHETGLATQPIVNTGTLYS